MKTIQSLWAAVALGCGLISSSGAMPQPGLSFQPAEAGQLQRLLEQRREVASNAVRVAEQIVGTAYPASLLVVQMARISTEIDLMRARLAEMQGPSKGLSLPSGRHPQ